MIRCTICHNPCRYGHAIEGRPLCARCAPGAQVLHDATIARVEASVPDYRRLLTNLVELLQSGAGGYPMDEDLAGAYKAAKHRLVCPRHTTSPVPFDVLREVLRARREREAQS